MSAAHSFLHPDPSSDPKPRRLRHHWERIIAWIAGAMTLLTVLAIVTVAILLHSRRFHNYLLAKADSIASQKLNTEVTLENFTLHFSPLSLDVYGLTVHGASPYPNPPILQLQHANVGVRIVSLLHMKWYFSTVQLDHPVVQVLVDKHGVSNIPTPAPTNSNSNTSIFDLGIRRAILNQGEVFCNSEPQPLSADLHDVEFRAGFTPANKVYSGWLQYTQGRVVYGTFAPFVHNFAARFEYSPTTFQLDQAEISSGATKIFLAAAARNFSQPIVDAKYDVTIDAGQMGRLMNNAALPAGLFHLRGSAAYQRCPGQAGHRNRCAERRTDQSAARSQDRENAGCNRESRGALFGGQRGCQVDRSACGPVGRRGNVARDGDPAWRGEFAFPVHSFAAPHFPCRGQSPCGKARRGAGRSGRRAQRGRKSRMGKYHSRHGGERGRKHPRNRCTSEWRCADGAGEHVRADNAAHRKRDSRHLQRRPQRDCAHAKAICAPPRPR